MKASIRTLVTIVSLAASTAVFAQTYNEAPLQQQQQQPPQQQPPQQPPQQAQSQQSPAGAQAPQWAAPHAAYTGKTRAQVYAELVEAQRSGQLAYLNRTVYAHH
ncbi:DUF4148 domain-containing protein [Paraburkholderia sp. 2C]